jgi:hypothetical protein
MNQEDQTPTTFNNIKNVAFTIYFILVTIFCFFLFSLIEEKDYEYSIMIDSLMDEQHYFLEYLKIEKQWNYPKEKKMTYGQE